MRRLWAVVAWSAIAPLGACQRKPPPAAKPAPVDASRAAVAASAPADAALADAASATAPPPKPAARRFRRIDVHTHIGPDGIARAEALMKTNGGSTAW